MRQSLCGQSIQVCRFKVVSPIRRSVGFRQSFGKHIDTRESALYLFSEKNSCGSERRKWRILCLAYCWYWRNWIHVAKINWIGRPFLRITGTAYCKLNKLILGKYFSFTYAPPVTCTVRLQSFVLSLWWGGEGMGTRQESGDDLWECSSCLPSIQHCCSNHLCLWNKEHFAPSIRISDLMLIYCRRPNWSPALLNRHTINCPMHCVAMNFSFVQSNLVMSLAENRLYDCRKKKRNINKIDL